MTELVAPFVPSKVKNFLVVSLKLLLVCSLRGLFLLVIYIYLSQYILGQVWWYLLGPSCRLTTASRGRWIGGRPPDMVASCDLSGWPHLTNKQLRTWQRQSRQTLVGRQEGHPTRKNLGGCGDGVAVSFGWGGVHRDCRCLPSPLSSPRSTKIQNKQWWRTIRMMG